MTSNLPPKLKTPEITRYVHRAAQLQEAKPVIAYWCKYWVVNQILSKGLHTTDAECMNYTTNLMDKLEQTKASNANNDAIVDDMAGQAYVEQFGYEVFQRADNAMQANKATRQTSDTFQAAATFLELVNIWGAPDPDVASKIKYAKFHAVRIVKAVQAGEDPNASNPAPEEAPNLDEMQLDQEDPEVQLINGPSGVSNRQRSRQASVEEVPDEHDQIQPKLAATSRLNESLHPSRSSSVPRPRSTQSPTLVPTPPGESNSARDFYTAAGPGSDVSPLESPTIEPKASGGAGYFPNVPTFTGEEEHPTLGTASAQDLPMVTPTSGLPDPTQMGLPRMPPVDGGSAGPPNIFRPTASPTGSLAASSLASSQEDFAGRKEDVKRGASIEHTQPYIPPKLKSHYFHAQPTGQGLPKNAIQQRPPPTNLNEEDNFISDEEAILKAQKHARWAISALNFEDVKTAVKELRGALETLGAR